MQTNEPARRATLLPVLARLPQPLALIEVGASAGLCLMADRYGYDYRRGLVRPSVDQLDPPVFSCVVNATTPVPTAPPRVTWRAGLDLDPVDPMIAARAATEGPTGCFLMAVNGVPVGWTDPHGASLDWISEIPESEG